MSKAVIEMKIVGNSHRPNELLESLIISNGINEYIKIYIGLIILECNSAYCSFSYLEKYLGDLPFKFDTIVLVYNSSEYT